MPAATPSVISASIYWPPTVKVWLRHWLFSLVSNRVVVVSRVRSSPAPGTPRGIRRPSVSVLLCDRVDSSVPKLRRQLCASRYCSRLNSRKSL
ncbi:hypothetical protein D3C73_1322510 [compost metagenome]